MVFIPKAVRPFSIQPRSYRPIRLSSFLLETMEKMIDRQIRDVYLERDPMSIAQYAYQTGWSTTIALHCLVTKIEGAHQQE